MSRCLEHKNEYYKCLSKSDRNPSKCVELQNTLEKCSEEFDEYHCVKEMVNLLNCSRNPGPDVCAKEFVLMRECNRPGGPHIVIEDGYYKLRPEVASEYNVVGDIISPTTAPRRSLDNIKNYIAKLKTSLGLPNFTEEFKPQIKS